MAGGGDFSRHAPAFVRYLFEVGGDMRSKRIHSSRQTRVLELAISQMMMLSLTGAGCCEADSEVTYWRCIKHLLSPCHYMRRARVPRQNCLLLAVISQIASHLYLVRTAEERRL